MTELNFEAAYNPEKETTLEIVYGPEREAKYTKELISELLPWFKKNGYVINLPDGITEASTEEEIAEATNKEYDETYYKERADTLMEQWNQFFETFKSARDLMSCQFLDKYTIVLTQYGTYGAYDAKSAKVMANIKRNDFEKVLGTIIHEIIHISIEPLIQKYKTKHQYKERLVGLIGEKLFPSLDRKLRPIKDVENVDKAFSLHFPDIEEVIKAI